MLIQSAVESAILSLEPTKAGAKKTWAQVAAGSKAVDDFEIDDDAELTTDIGESAAASETESSSGFSSTEREQGRALGRRCRFGSTALETIPATPVGAMAQASVASPPGLSRFAMRQARDALTGTSEADTSCCSSAVDDDAVPLSSRPCRFGTTPLGTVPSTPPTTAKWKALAKANCIRSPPGLSRAALRQARDSQQIPTTSWGGQQMASASPSKRRSRELLLQRAKDGAALLQAEAEARKRNAESTEAEEASQVVASADEQTSDVGHSSSSEESSTESSAAEVQQCRFGCSPLETVPATPGAELSPASPPGLSRAAMRQARDSCKGVAGEKASMPVLTIGPDGKAMTPPSMYSAKRREVRDALLARAREEGLTRWIGHTSHAIASLAR